MKKVKISKRAELYLMKELTVSLKAKAKPVQLPDSKDELLALIDTLSGKQLDDVREQVYQTYYDDKQFCSLVYKAIISRREKVKLQNHMEHPFKTRLQERRDKIDRENRNEAYHQTHPIRIEYTPMGGQNGKTHH